MELDIKAYIDCLEELKRYRGEMDLLPRIDDFNKELLTRYTRRQLDWIKSRAWERFLRTNPTQGRRRRIKALEEVEPSPELSIEAKKALRRRVRQALRGK